MTRFSQNNDTTNEILALDVLIQPAMTRKDTVRTTIKRRFVALRVAAEYNQLRSSITVAFPKLIY